MWLGANYSPPVQVAANKMNQESGEKMYSDKATKSHCMLSIQIYYREGDKGLLFLPPRMLAST